MRSTATRIDDEVGSKQTNSASVSVTHAVNTPLFVHEPLHDTVTFTFDVGERECTAPYAVLNESPTLAVRLKPEILRLSYWGGAGGVRLPVREIPDRFLACTDPYGTKST